MIIQNGIDVTEQVTAKAKTLGSIAMASKNYQARFNECFVYLIKAKEALDNIERPWMDNCIYENINKIDDLIKNLKGKLND